MPPASHTQPTVGERRREIFLKALEQSSAAERAAYLDLACRPDAGLRQEIEALLKEHAAMDGFLETPALAGTEPARREEPPHPLGAETDWGTAEQPGNRIGRYRLIEKIGEGGVGIVYLAEQEEPVRRRVALKVLKLGMDTRSVVARFEAERQALALMDHPNIATVLDAGATATGRPYFVMELVRGTRITAYCDEYQVNTRDRLSLFVQVCQAIQHAHQKGIIHRDIKPSNILVTRHDGVPVPKVIDFGIAKATEHRLTERTLVTAFTAFMGTPAYMSPEQAEMSGLDVDTRSDVYSLGVLLYELLTGGPPFDPQALLESGLDACRRTIREVEPVRPSTRLETMVGAMLTNTAQRRRVEPPQLIHLLRGDLDWVVMKCLEKDRRRRYETASDLAHDVQRYLANEPVQARPPSQLYRFQKFLGRNRGKLAAVTGVALALIVGTGVSVWQAVRATRAEQVAVAAQFEERRLRLEAERQRAAARLNEYVADINLTQQSLEAGNLGRALQLLAKHGPEVGEPDLRGFEWRHLWLRAQGDDHVSLPVQEESVQALALAPDGELLAVGLRKSCVIWNVRLRSPVCRLPQGGLSAHFLPSGDQLVTADEGAVRVWSTRGWTEQRVLANGMAPVALSPDGTCLAAVARGGVRLWDVANWSEAGWLPAADGPLTFSPDGQTMATGGRDGITLWSWRTRERRVRLEDSAHLYMLRGFWFGGGTLMAFSPDGQQLVAPRNRVSERGAFVLSVWDTTSGLEAGVLPAAAERIEHTGVVTGAVLAPDGQTLVTTSMDHSVRLWDLRSRRCVARLRGHLNEVWALALSGDGQTLVSGSKDGAVKLWAVRRPPAANLLPGQAQPLAFAANSETLAVWMRDQRIEFLDPTTLGIKGEFRLERGPFPFRPPLSFSADLGTLAEGLPNGGIRVVHLANRTEQVFQTDDGRRLEWIALTPDAQSLVAGGRNLPVHWWDLTTSDHGTFGTEGSQGMFSADGSTLAILVGGSGVEIYDAGSRVRRAHVETHADALFVAALSPDGRLLATSGPTGADHVVEVWDAPTGRHVGDLRGHKQGIHALAFAPDGRTIASTGANGTLKLWNVATQQELLSYEHPGGSPGAGLLFSPDGRLLVGPATPGPGTSGTRFYRAPSWEEVATARRDD